MLGRLARWLRAVGVDTAYERGIEDDDLLSRCEAESRILLTRDNELAGRGGDGVEVLLVESESTPEQLRQVMESFGLELRDEMLFSRCTHCNTLVEEMPREQARGRVPPFVYESGERFTWCPLCDKVYWRGTHKERFLEQIAIREEE